jgi:hypothetical protein
MKLWPFEKPSNARPTGNSDAVMPETQPSPGPVQAAAPGKPVYQKPVLRRYDQVDQVRPYGPSEI